VGERTELLACVDETGRFVGTTEFLGVGGPVWKVGPGGDRELVARLRKALPHVGFPPHAAHLNRRSYHLVRWLLLAEDRRKKLPPPLAQGLAGGGRHLVRHGVRLRSYPGSRHERCPAECAA